ncbi:hypothetical protein GCM10007160_42170 [Litchfieldella qijiaojingensis]|uniref:Apea-like HEPN domain-containing protein n=1 Tax=Litchfieldella qijiaojingensis TaxID=980347 RepID=A0ABQ2ZEF4_9GAMM|nr:methylamine utilization protein MauJ [Halomonas qijiaojingensis]GGY10525.1 hypothetical protein GCM10007160_42170 [Halomonas qijiaojingensis]
MAINYEYALTNSKGMKKVVSFEGLAFPILIAPTLHGEPLLTAQAIYYLSRLESAVRIRFEDPKTLPKHRTNKELERWFEYIIDNYLFEYSKRYPYEQITSKITDLKYWENDGHTYIGYDENNTQALALDTLNDPSVLEIGNEDLPSIGHWSDWCLVSNYTYEYIATYVSSMASVLSKTVKVKTNGHDELGTGEFDLPLVRTEGGVLNYYQACMLEVLQPNRIKVIDGRVLVSRGMQSTDDFTLPLESIKASKYYDADLLSYYFAAVREDLPISRFRCFYNVLEYFFEDAPKHLGEAARIEREQISCVLRWVADSSSLSKFIGTLGQSYIAAIEQQLSTSSGIKINAIKVSSPDLDRLISEWLYAIRCAIVHSKRTRKGNVEARLVPYSEDEEIGALAVPIVQHIAILCIDKDGEVKV